MQQEPEKSKEAGGKRPYMPTPDQYVQSLDHGSLSGSASHVGRRVRPARPIHDRKHGFGKRIFLWSALVAGTLMFSYGGYIVVTVAKISTKPFDLAGLSDDGSGRTNVLVLGVGDPGHAGQNLSDTIMLMSLNRSDKRVAQISVPRDLRVNIPGYGYAKINQANADGGPALAEQTVANTLSVPVNYYVKTDFTGLKDLVDAVGGIDVNVVERLYDPEYPCDYDQYKACGLDIEPGKQHMSGTLALEYVRCRKGTCGNDFGRAARQQEVLRLVREQVLKPAVILEPWKLIKVVNVVRAHAATDMGTVQLAEFALGWQAASKHDPINLVLSTAPGGYLVNAGGGSSDLLPRGGSFEAIGQVTQGIFDRPSGE